MASVLELALSYFGRTQPVSTPLPPLGVHNRLNQLQRDSEQYFTIGLNAQAANGSQLAVTIKPDQAFDLANESHTRFIGDCTTLLQEKSKALKDLDQTVMASVVVGVVASTLSFLPLVGYLSWLGWGSATYHLSQRSLAYAEYQEALKLSVACCNWSLGPKAADRTASRTPLESDPVIRNMMVMLYPVLTRTQIKHLIADDIEETFASELSMYENKYKLPFNSHTMFASPRNENIALSKKGAEFNRCVYGFNKGSAMDFVDAFVSFLPDLYNLACYGCRQAQRKWQEYTAPSVEQRPAQV